MSRPRRPRLARPSPGPKFAVLGAGHGGLAMAGHLAYMGFRVNLWNRTAERIEHIRLRGGIGLEGAVEGEGRLEVATSDMKEAVSDAQIIMVAVPANAHHDVATGLADVVHDGQVIVLNPGRTGGAIEVRNILAKKGVGPGVTVAEAQTFLYTARRIEPSSAHIFDIKNEVAMAALPAYKTPEVLKMLRVAFPQFIPGDNVLRTGMENVGAIFHPGVMILNAARIESTHGDFQYYLEGITPSVAVILEAMDNERRQVADALGIRTHTVREWLYLTYSSPGRDLYQAIQSTPGYKGIMSPAHLNHRYILEDIPMSLVPIASIGEMFDVKTPAIRAMIHLASLIHGRDFWKEGRTVERLGIKGMSVKEIRFLAVGASS
ncbi:MAG TPA: NAD/NADP octopine/nopaline dehydrogenase family protein [Thermoplasmata archaeon]